VNPEDTFELNENLTLFTPDNEPLTVTLQKVNLTRLSETVVGEITIQISVAAQQFLHEIDSEGRFNLWRGVIHGESSFDAEQPVQLKLRLSMAHFIGLYGVASRAQDIAHMLLHMSVYEQDAVFVQTESWFATAIFQDGADEVGSGPHTYTVWHGEVFGKIFVGAVRVLVDEDIPFRRVGEATMLQLTESAEGPMDWETTIDVRDEDDVCIVYGDFPGQVPAARELAVAEFLHRANAGLPLGNFEMDYTNLKIRFKMSIDVGGAAFDVGLVRNLILGNIYVFGDYINGIQAVIDGAAPFDAIQAIEGI
jgi:hypothetical protein